MKTSFSESSYFKVGSSGISPFQSSTAYLGGSLIQTVLDNPVTAFRQLVQQLATDKKVPVDPSVARSQAIQIFKRSPVAASLSGLGPRIVGVGLKRIPKFVSFLGVSAAMNENNPGLISATAASIISAPFINPVRMIEKQQRADLKITGRIKPVIEILKESAHDNFRPLMRGTIPLVAHSFVSATLGLVGQPRLQRSIEEKLSASGAIGKGACNLLASSIVSPIYVFLTNPIARLEVIMQTASVRGRRVSITEATRELWVDAKTFGARGALRGNGIGIIKAILALSLFHEGRLFFTDIWIEHNKRMMIN